MGSYVQAYTLYSSVRPFGITAIVGGFDAETEVDVDGAVGSGPKVGSGGKTQGVKEGGPYLYMIEPSGMYWGYYGAATGKGRQAAKAELEKLNLDPKKGDTISGGAGDDTIDLGLDPRPATAGTRVVIDGLSYADAPAAVVVDFRAAATSVITADGTDTISGYGEGIRVIGSPQGDMIKGTNSDDVIHGRAVKNKEALANPEALDLFAGLDALKS